MGEYAYGQQPPDIGAADFGLGWLAGVRHLRMSAAGESFWHAHREIQLLYCIKGEFGYVFESGPSEILTAGHYIVIPAGLRHRHVQAIDPAGHRIELLVQPPRGKSDYGTIPPAVAAKLVDTLLRTPCAAQNASRDLDKAFRRLDALAACGARALSPADLALARTLASLALQLCAEPPQETVPKRADGRLMDEAVAWLERHFGENVRMERLVAYMGYSRSRLFDLFRKHTGLSPADYLARYRIRAARKLLETTNRKVSDIARACGFATPQYFNAAFRRQTGQTPTAWRERRRIFTTRTESLV